jgi:hypothetical protein
MPATISFLRSGVRYVLGYVSGDQMGSLEAKKRSRKSHAWAPLISHVKSPVVNDCFGTVNTTNIKYFHSSAGSEANRHPIKQL